MLKSYLVFWVYLFYVVALIEEGDRQHSILAVEVIRAFLENGLLLRRTLIHSGLWLRGHWCNWENPAGAAYWAHIRRRDGSEHLQGKYRLFEMAQSTYTENLVYSHPLKNMNQLWEFLSCQELTGWIFVFEYARELLNPKINRESD